MFRVNHRTAEPSLEVGTRQLTTSTSRGTLRTATEDNGTTCDELYQTKTTKPRRSSEKCDAKLVAETIMRKQICTSHFAKITFHCLQNGHQKESCVSAQCLLLDLSSKTVSEGDGAFFLFKYNPMHAANQLTNERKKLDSDIENDLKSVNLECTLHSPHGSRQAPSDPCNPDYRTKKILSCTQ